MANNVVEVNADIAPELMSEIKNKVKELREQNSKLHGIFPIIVEGDEFDEKESYIGYFSQPSFKSFSKYLTASQNGNNVVAMRALAEECFIAGDKELVENDSLFMFGLMGQLHAILEVRNSKLVNLSRPGK